VVCYPVFTTFEFVVYENNFLIIIENGKFREKPTVTSVDHRQVYKMQETLFTTMRNIQYYH